MDLSKAFDSLPHDLLIAKFAAYGFGQNARNLLRSYLTNRFQRTKVGSSYSIWLLIILGVPQGSVLGPLLFNIFINDIFSFIINTEVCNFADDNTIYCCSDSMETILCSLELDLKRCLDWFRANELLANPDKFKIMFLGVKHDKNFCLTIDNNKILSTDHVKLLGIHIDNKLKFGMHITKICESANKKVKCMFRIRKYITEKQALILSNAYVMSNFYYCAPIWMFCNRTLSSMMDNVHQRCLRAIYGFSGLSLSELLQKEDMISIHARHLRFIMIEVFKSLNMLNPVFMKDFFQEKLLPYNLRDSSKLILPCTKKSRFGTNSIHFKACVLWNSLPVSVKSAKSLSSFKTQLQKVIIKCTCHLCHH